MLPTGDGDRGFLTELGITVQVIRQERFLEPGQPIRFQSLHHLFRIKKIPAHVGVGHDLNVITDGIANICDVLLVGAHAGNTVAGTVRKAHLHGLIAFLDVGLGFGLHLLSADRMQR